MSVLHRAGRNRVVVAASPLNRRRLLVDCLEGRRLLAAVSWDGGGDGVNWTDDNNWSTNAQPTSADDVTINIAANPTIRLNGAAANIRSLTSAEALNLDSGTLTLANASSITAATTLSGATIAGPGNLTLNNFTWTSGTMDASGKTVLSAGSTGTIVDGGSYFLGRTLEVAGTLSIATTGGSPIYMGTSSTSPGTIDIVNGGTATLTANGNIYGYYAGQVIVRAGGTLAKAGAGTTPSISVPLNILGGAVRANAGVFTLNTAITGTGGSIAGVGSGVVNLAGGIDTFDNTLLQNVQLTGATIAGAGTVTLNNVTWNGGTMSGTGKTVVAAGTTSMIADGSSVFLGRTLEVDGTLNIATTSGYPIYMGSSSTEPGTLDVVNGGAIAITADANLYNYYGGQVIVRTGGSLTKSNVGTAIVGVAMNLLGGTLGATNGVLSLTGGGTSTGGSLASTSPGIVDFAGGAHAFSGTLSGSGTGNNRISGGTVTIDTAATLQNLQQTGGTITGAGTLTINNLTWTGGTMAGTGKTVIPAATTSTISDGTVVMLGRTLEVDGTLNIATTSGYSIYMGSSSTEPGTLDVMNGGSVVFTADGNLYSYYGGTAIVRTGGTLTKSGAGPSPTVGIPLSLLGGTINATAGVFSLTNAITGIGGTITGVGAGVVSLAAGTDTFSGTLIQNGQLAGATIAGAGTVTFKNVAWSSGTMSGTGKTVIAAGTTSTIADGANHMLGRTLEVDGTLNVANVNDAIYMGTSNTELGVFDVVIGGTLAFTDNATLYNYYGGQVIVRTGGNLTKSGAGTATIGVPLNNSGTVTLTGGQLSLSAGGNFGSATAVDNGFLSGGHFKVGAGTTLGITTGFYSLTADIEITGTGSVPALSTLAVNNGRIALLDGASLTITPPYNGGNPPIFANQGIIDLAAGTHLSVQGDMVFNGPSQPIIRLEAGPSAFATLAVSGKLFLNVVDTTSRFDPDLAAGYNPAIGLTIPFITAADGVVGNFDAFLGGSTANNLGHMIYVRPSSTEISVQIAGGAAPSAPQLVSATYEDQTRQAIVFQFTQDVSAFLTRKDYRITNLTTGQALPQSAGTIEYNLASNVATLLLTNEMPDGNYQLVVQSTDIGNSSGIPLSGSVPILSFFVLRGDANHDRAVNFTDLLLLAQNYGFTGRDYAHGNFDYSADGAVTFADLLLLAQQYGKTLAAPPAISVQGLASKTATKQRVASTVLA